MLKRGFFAIICTFVLALLATESFPSQTKTKEDGKDAKMKDASVKSDKKSQAKQEVAVIDTKFGKITIEFLPDVAPNHVANFKKLAKEGFYNGTTFHRVIPGFMIQGGDPNTKRNDRSTHGTGGPGYSVNAEFNNTKHLRGIVSMARAADPNSAGSQFFICVADSTFLDRQYTAFGKVVEGMDVVDKIVSVPRDERDNPYEKIEMKKVYLETR